MTNDIESFVNCKRCVDEAQSQPGVSPQEHARIELGFTTEGLLQVWCNRHDEHICQMEVVLKLD